MNDARNTPPAHSCLHDDEGFLGLIGPVWERWDDGRLVLTLTAADKHANQRGVVMGGVFMTLADRVMGHALRVQLAGQPIASIQLDTHFLAAGEIGDTIEARAHVARVTKSVAFVDGMLTIGERDVMTARGIWKRLRDDDGSAAAAFEARFGRSSRD